MTTAKKKPYRDMERELVTRVEDLPDFDSMSRAEEAEWWNTHDLAESVLDTSPVGMKKAREETYAALGIPDPAKREK